MSEVMFHKVVASLPPTLEADSVYYVRVGSGWTQYVTNSSGVIVAYEQNVYLPDAVEVAVTDAGNYFVSNDVEGVLQELGSDVVSIEEALDGKVDVVEGMGLSQENFTTQEKDKLSLLEEPMFKGMFSSYAELVAAYPTGQAGNYAQVAGAPGEPSTTYSWDVVTGQWVEQVPEASPEQVKQLYESNPDTNAFTDPEKSKLAGVATGATANATDAQLRDRATHTGVQAISTITGLQGELDNISTTYVTKAEFNNTIGDIASTLDAINGEVI